MTGLFAAATIAVSIGISSPQTVPARPAAPASRPAAAPDRATLLDQAAKAQQAGRVDEAMRLLRVAGETHGSVQAWLELARLQSRGKQPLAALATLAKARALAPNAEDVLAAYAQIALALRQPQPAVLALEDLTRMCPTVAQYHYLLGVGLMAIGDMPAAGDALVRADRLEPDRPLTLLALGLVLNSRKQYAEAKAVLIRSLEQQPESVEAVAALAEAEAGLGDFDAAARDATRALARAPGNATANLVIGLVLTERRDYAGARDALLKAAAADPDSTRTPYQLSLVFARLGDTASSERYLEVYRRNLAATEERINMVRAGGALPAKSPAVKQ